MAEDTPIYGKVHSKSDVRKVFTAIRTLPSFINGWGI